MVLFSLSSLLFRPKSDDFPQPRMPHMQAAALEGETLGFAEWISLLTIE